MILFLISCLMYKTSLVGIVDHIGLTKCTVELDTGDLIVVESAICKKLKEGDKIYFYGSRK